jgi:hypothetical protein
MTDTLNTLQPYLLTLHVLSVVVGMGSATAADVLFGRYLRNWRISKREADTLHTLARVVLGATGALFLTGLTLVLRDVPGYLASPPFQLKMTMVSVLLINGFLLHHWVTGHFVDLSFRSQHSASWLRRRRPLRQIAFALGAVSVCSWYGAFFISMLKRDVLQLWNYPELLGCYLLILSCSIIVSQYVVTRLERAARRG